MDLGASAVGLIERVSAEQMIGLSVPRGLDATRAPLRAPKFRTASVKHYQLQMILNLLGSLSAR